MRRHFWHLLVPLFLVSLGLFSENTAAGAALSPADHAALSPFGVNFLKWEFLKGHADAFEDLRARMKIMKDAGVYWDRDGIDKTTVNPHPGVWDWSFTDQVVSLARQQGIHLAVILMGGPPPRDDAGRASYAEYVYQTVHRYHEWVKVWEIWNEPNIPSFWENPDVHLYTLMLKAAYTAAKRADPGCTVLGGSANGPGGDWFDGIAKEGGWGYCDAISMHPYAMADNPVKQRLDLILRTLQHIVDRHGPKPIWITEVGWRSDPNPAAEADQAISVFQTFVIALANRIRNIDYFCMDNYDEWGLIRSIRPFVPKPSYLALQELTRALGSPGPAARFLGYLPAPPGVACFDFDAGGSRRVLILWNNHSGAAPVDLRQKTGLAVKDISGRAIPIDRGVLTITATPVIITGADARRIGRPDAGADPFVLPKGANLIFNGALNTRRDPATGVWQKPGDWFEGVFNAGGKHANFTVSDAGRGGSTCVSIAHSRGTAAWNSSIIPVEPGKTYRLTAWIKTENASGQSAAAIYWYSGNQWTPLGTVKTAPLSGTHDWTHVETEGKVPPDASFVRVHLLSADNTGVALFDDVSLVER